MSGYWLYISLLCGIAMAIYPRQRAERYLGKLSWHLLFACIGVGIPILVLILNMIANPVFPSDIHVQVSLINCVTFAILLAVAIPYCLVFCAKEVFRHYFGESVPE